MSGCSNPGKCLLARKPGGGTNPMGDPRGNTGSAADAGTPPSDAVVNRINAMNRSIMNRFLQDEGHRYSPHCGACLHAIPGLIPRQTGSIGPRSGKTMNVPQPNCGD